MKFKIESATDIGNYRKSNQDYIGYFEKKDRSLIAIVCDGMGGHAHGEIASKMGVDIFLKSFKETDLKLYSDQEINVWMRSTVKNILVEMKQHSELFPETKDMGTTLTTIIFVNKKAFVLNIGDSRTYKIHNNKISQITKDQNLWNETKNNSEKRKEIKKFLEAKFNELTYWKVLTSALGPNKNLKIDTYLINDPEGIYLLTTDGIHDYIDKTTIKDLVQEKGKFKHKPKHLLEYAMNNMSTDNLSLILINAAGE